MVRKSKMILEVALLDMKEGQESAFEADFAVASKYISCVEGYISHQLHRCIEKKNRYILLAHWNSLEAHTRRFRESRQYREWSRILHHYYDPFPEVQHYAQVS
jgi:heme-degrading monooxygenase HmoA